MPDSHRWISFSRILYLSKPLNVTYISIDVEVSLYGGRSAKQELVVYDVRTRCLALDVDPIGAAGYNVTLLDEYVGLRETLEHDSATFKMSQSALL